MLQSHRRSRTLFGVVVASVIFALLGCSDDLALQAPSALEGPEALLQEAVVERSAGMLMADVRTAGELIATEGSSNAPVVASFGRLDYVPTTAMVIRTGTATIEVDSLDQAIVRVRRGAQAVGGYVGDLGMHSGAQQVRQATLQVKIPTDRFEDFLSTMEPIGDVQALDLSAQDVSEEFVDLRARAANDSRLEARLIELLDKRTGDLADVLTVERELARVRAGIEQVEGRLRYLQQRAHMSTLQIQLHEPGPLLTHAAGPNPIVVAVRQAWTNMIGVIASLIAVAGSVLPFAVLGLVGLLIWRRFRPITVIRNV